MIPSTALIHTWFDPGHHGVVHIMECSSNKQAHYLNHTLLPFFFPHKLNGYLFPTKIYFLSLSNDKRTKRNQIELPDIWNFIKIYIYSISETSPRQVYHLAYMTSGTTILFQYLNRSSLHEM